MIEAARAIARRTPGGEFDAQALAKLAAEQAELEEELDAHDAVGAWTELADVAYYAAKAVIAGLLAADAAESVVAVAEQQCGLAAGAGLAAMQAKYASRLAIGKDDAAERAAVEQALRPRLGQR